jgi:hypothetical protein
VSDLLDVGHGLFEIGLRIDADPILGKVRAGNFLHDHRLADVSSVVSDAWHLQKIIANP